MSEVPRTAPDTERASKTLLGVYRLAELPLSGGVFDARLGSSSCWHGRGIVCSGLFEYKAKRYAAAHDHFARTLELVSQNPKLGLTLLMLRRPSDARVYFKIAARLRRHDAPHSTFSPCRTRANDSIKSPFCTWNER
jgi:hypothetical protein